jgi:SsrA-binding protein
MTELAINKRANFDYEVLEKYEAGLVLFGHEVKSVRKGNVSLSGAYVTLKAGPNGLPEAHLINAHISLYKYASTVEGYDPTRSRKLLLKAKDINYLLGKKKTQGLTLVPLRVYTKGSFLKLELAVCRGKKQYDKRDDLKKKDLDREKRRALKGERLD